jgi:LytS/YehU family sensor histidine kinase
MGPRLPTVIQVDKDVEQTLIPVLSIQPLVENAVKHGLSPCPDEGWLRLRASSLDGTLTIVVEDSGTGPTGNTATDQPAGARVGMANVSRRLQLCFGRNTDLKMHHDAFGTRVQFSVPLGQAPVV